MSAVKAPILLLALGNDLLGDDGCALAAAREIRKSFDTKTLDVIESSEAGLALMELMTGYEKALLLDSIKTEKCEPGTVIEFGVEDFRKIVAPSPHYAGIPEVLQMAERLGIPFPGDLRILAMEVVNPFEFREEFTPEVKAALPNLIKKATAIIEEMREPVNAKNFT